jgi:hypothetical protein
MARRRRGALSLIWGLIVVLFWLALLAVLFLVNPTTIVPAIILIIVIRGVRKFFRNNRA